MNKKILLISLSLLPFLAILLMRIRRQHITDVVVPTIDAEKLFGQLKDFRNYPKINPKVAEYSILHENETFQAVSYSEYYEFLPSWMMNHAVGHYQIDNVKKIIDSIHYTCLIGDLYCLKTLCRLEITPESSSYDDKELLPSAKIHEDIIYECPSIMRSICRAEVESQRKNVFDNLLNSF